jgi:hypothetical protein
MEVVIVRSPLQGTCLLQLYVSERFLLAGRMLCPKSKVEKSMKLVMTLLVRDEQDILESNIDYHLSQGIDFIIVTDNLSVDRTPEILDRYRKRGVLHVIKETRDDYSQHEWVTRMARMAASDYGADWVINNDADEFWWPETDRDLRSYFSRIPEAIQAITVKRDNFPIVYTEVSDDKPFYERLIYRDTASENPLGRPLPPKVCHRAHPNIKVQQGNHRITLAGNHLTTAWGELTIFHFPARSYTQFQNKIRLGGAAYARNMVLDKSIGGTWRWLYEEYNEGRLKEFYLQQIPDAETFASRMASGRYIRDIRLRDYLRPLVHQPA